MSFTDGAESISGDGTDITFAVGSDGDINIPADIGLTFGNDGEKIEGNGTDLTIAGNNINLTAVADVVIPANVGLTFGTGEKIEGDSTDLTVTSGGAINLTATTDVVIPANVGVTFGSGEKIEGDDTDLTVTSGGKINLTATSDIHVPANVGVVFGTGEKIEGDSTDLTVTSGGKINLTATSDVVLPVSVGLIFGDGGEHIESNNTDLTVTSGGDIKLTATNQVQLPSGVELQLDGSTGSNQIVYDSSNTKLQIKAGGDLELSLSNASSNQIVPAADNTHDLGRTESLGSSMSGADLDNNLTAGQSITMATSGRNAVLYGNSLSISAGSAISALAGSVVSSSSLSSSTSSIFLSGFSGSTITAGTVLEFTEGSDKMYFVVLSDVESSASTMSVKYHSGISGGTSSLSLSSGADSVKAVTASSGAFAHSSPSISAGHAISFEDGSGNLYVFEVMAAPSSNSLAVVVDANDSISTGSAFSASSVSTDSGLIYQSYKTNLKFNQLAITQVDFNSAVFMSGSSDGIHFKAASGDRFQFDDAPLYLKDMTAPSTTTNRLYAVNAGLYWNGGLLQAKKAKEVKALSAAVSAGSVCNISGMSHDQGANPLKSDVFLNGQLMMSGSSASAGDYTMSHTAFTDLGSGMTVGSGQTLSTSSTSLTVSLSSSNYLKLKAGSIIKFVASGGTFEFRVSATGAPSSDSATSIGGTVVRTSGSASSIDPQSDPSATTVSSVVDADDIVFHFALEVDDVVQVSVMA